MRRKRRTKVAFRFYVLMFIALCLFVYGGYLAIDRMVQRTGVIELDNMGNQYSAQAIVVRSERLTDVEGLSSVVYSADEGAMVYKGNKIASVYSTGYSQSDRNKLLDIRQKIKNNHNTKLASDYTDLELNRLDAQITDYVREMEMLVHGKAEGNLLNLERQLRSAMESRYTYLKKKYTDQNLEGLYASETQLVKKMESWMTPFLADADCIVSFYTDGYENVLDVNSFDTISIALAHSILAGEAPATTAAQRGRTAVFRQVRPNGWYLLLVSQDPNWKPVIGNSYKVELAGFDDHVVDGVVTSFTRSGNELLVRMTVAGDVRPVLNLRTTTAKVGEMYVSGLRVPIDALYLHPQLGQLGVVLTDGYFVPVIEIMRDHQYVVIQPVSAGTLAAGQKVKLF